MTVTIKRIDPRPGGDEYPVLTKNGYQLADPSMGARKHWAKYAVYTETIEEVADMVEARHFHVRMGRKGQSPSLICPNSLQILRDKI